MNTKLLSMATLAASILLTCSPAQALEQTVKSKAVGNVTLKCDDPGAWKIDMKLTPENGKEVIVITMKADKPQNPPRFGVSMSTPQLDTHHLWNATNDNRCQLRPDWSGYYNSQLAFDMPLYSFINENNENRLTVVSDEPLRRVDAHMGLREEGSMLVAELNYFNVPEAPIDHYETKILLDSRPIFWGKAISEGVEWMTNESGIKPIEAPESAFDPLYSSWYQFHQNVTDKGIEDECRTAAKLGMKTLIVDDGWQTDDNNRGYAFCGDWEVSKNRFPDMKSHVKKVQDMGLKYMVWYSVPFVGKKSNNFEKFNGKYLWVDHEKGALDPRFPEVREFLCNTYVNAMNEWNLDGFKLDFIDSFSTGNDPAVAENYAGRDIKSLPEAINVLMTEVYNRLKAIKPDVLIEFRQAYIGPAIRQYGNMLRAGDCPGDMQSNRQRIANLRLTSGNSAVHSDMLEWNEADTPENAARHILSALFGVVQYSMMLNHLPEDHMKVIRHWLDFSQKHRKTLLKSDFRPYHPEACYPVIEAESADERIIGLYNDTSIANIGESNKPVYILNATGTSSMIIDTAKKPKSAEAYNVYGEKVSVANPDKGVSHVNVPKSGYLLLKY